MFFRKQILLVVLCVALVVVFLSLSGTEVLIHPARTRYIDSVVVSLYQPVQMFVLKVSDYIKNVGKNYFALVGLKKENERLIKDVALKDLRILSLEEQLRTQKVEEAVGEQLTVMGLKGEFARVIAYDPLASEQAVWINKGSQQNIQIDQPVMTLDGLVGRVIKVFPATAQILLMVDPFFAVDVLDQKTRFRALIVGSGREASLKRYPILSHLEFLRSGDEINPGDLLITSGVNGLYPPGIPVGTVLEPMRDEDQVFVSSKVLPRVDFSKLEEVIVITTPLEEIDKSPGISKPSAHN